MAVQFEEMTDGQKQEAFNKWIASKSARKVTNSNKRAAVKALIVAHQDEYDRLLKGGKPAIKK